MGVGVDEKMTEIAPIQLSCRCVRESEGASRYSVFDEESRYEGVSYHFIVGSQSGPVRNLLGNCSVSRPSVV